MHPNAYDTLSQAVNDLVARGFTLTFQLREGGVFCDTQQQEFSPEAFRVVEFHRFEGSTDPADEAVVYAIEANTGTRGLLVTAYGAMSSTLSDELVQKLRLG